MTRSKCARLLGARLVCEHRHGVASRFAGSKESSFLARLSGWAPLKSPETDGTEASAAGATPLSERGPHASQLKKRGVLRFDGPDVISFLQGIVTNDLSRFKAEPPPAASPVPTPNTPAAVHPPLYSAILSPQGRFLYDLFFYSPSKPGDRLDRTGSGPKKSDDDTPVLLADVDAATMDELLELLKKHRLRANVSFGSCSDELAVWARYGGALANESGDAKEAEAGGMGYGGSDQPEARSAAAGSPGGWEWFKDPRLPALGMRGLFPKSNGVPPLVEAQEETPEEHFWMWRYEHGVPEGPVEIPKGDAMPLEYNLDGLNAISYEKGCYVGQELVARTHNRGVIRKRLFPVQFMEPGDANAEAQKAAVPGAEVVETASGKKAGKVTAAMGPRGLALLRLEYALKTDGNLQVVGSDGALVRPQQPKWWPAEWGNEEANT